MLNHNFCSWTKKRIWPLECSELIADFNNEVSNNLILSHPKKRTKFNQPIKKQKPRTKKRNSKSKSNIKNDTTYIWLPSDFHSWSLRKQQLWRNISENQLFYYYFLPPSTNTSLAVFNNITNDPFFDSCEFTDNEIQEMKQYLKIFLPKNENEWALFSFRFSNKTGKDCHEQYLSMMKDEKQNAEKNINNEVIVDINTIEERNGGKSIENVAQNVGSVSVNNYRSVSVNNYRSVSAANVIDEKQQKPKENTIIEESFVHPVIDNCLSLPTISMINSFTLNDCKNETRDIINCQCQALYDQMQGDIVRENECNANEVRSSDTLFRKMKMREKHKKQAEILFWKHAFLMSVDIQSFDIQVPFVIV